MKHFLFTVLIIIGFTTPPAQARDAKDSAVRQEVVQLVTMLSDGPATLVEESLLIKYVLSSSPGVVTNAVVLFNVESFGGGNNSQQFLAIFNQGSREDQNPDWPFHEWRLKGFTEVGKDWDRWFSEIQVQGDTITLSGVSWIKGKDAHCCPSGTAKATFRFSPYSIQEVPR